MINKLSISNFKSIKELDMDCTRVNLFIGEPNTGKSNIIEVLGLLSWLGNTEKNLNEFVRFKNIRQLFYEGLTDRPIKIYVDFKIDFNCHQTVIITQAGGKYLVDHQLTGVDSNYSSEMIMNVDGKISSYSINEIGHVYDFIRFYRFKIIDSFPDTESVILLPPYGSNLVSLIIASEKIRETITQLANDFRLKIMIRDYEQTIEFVKQLTDIISFSYPYITISDTLLRMIFYNVAIDSNKNSTLVFEEPEVHAFPSYIKQLGEKIAFDKSNQYFIATHNPYLLLSILEKTARNEVNVFITDFIENQTKVKCLNEEEKSELMDYDPFANLDYFLRTIKLENNK